MLKPNDVVITGIGMITPLGATAPETAEAWRAGRVAPRRRVAELAGTPLEAAEVAALPDFDAGARLGGRRMLKYMSEAAALGCIAAREALEGAGVKERFAPERIGLYAATGLAAASVDDIQGMLEASIDERGEFSERLLGERGLAATNPLISFKILANMPPCLISMMEGIKGPNLIFTPWEGQAGAALREAWLAVREGTVDGALAGAADSAAHPSTLVFLRQAGSLREGEAPGSGAGYLFMERAETALRDGRRIYAVVEEIGIAGGGWGEKGDEHGKNGKNGRDERDEKNGKDEKNGDEGNERNVSDPLAGRMGRMFAATPPVMIALGCMAGELNTGIETGAGRRGRGGSDYDYDYEHEHEHEFRLKPGHPNYEHEHEHRQYAICGTDGQVFSFRLGGIA